MDITTARKSGSHRLVVGILASDLPVGDTDKPAVAYAQDRVREALGSRLVGPVSGMAGHVGPIPGGQSVLWIDADYDAETDQDAITVFRVVLSETGAVAGNAVRWDDHTAESGFYHRSTVRLDEAPYAG